MDYVDEQLVEGLDAHDASSSYEAKQGEVNIFTLSRMVSMANSSAVDHSVLQYKAAAAPHDTTIN